MATKTKAAATAEGLRILTELNGGKPVRVISDAEAREMLKREDAFDEEARRQLEADLD